MLSFWEFDHYAQTDILIVGAGIIGLSTAISIKEHSPNTSVTVVERGIFPSGASTRNAGFACFGSLTEILFDMNKNGEETTVQLVEQRWRGLQILRARLGDAAIGFECFGGYETLFEEQLPALESLERVNTALQDIFPSPTFRQENEKIAAFGFNTERVKALVHSPFEGQIHSGMMMHALKRYAEERGVHVLYGANVLSIEEKNESVQVSVLHLDDTITFRAQQCALCTNAFIPKLLPSFVSSENVIKPARGQVLVTSLIPNLPFRGVFHLDEGFYYFRNLSTPAGQRILLGGGRNLAFEEEETTALELNPHIHKELDNLLRSTIAPHLAYTVEHRWSGIMGFRSDKLPEVRRASARCVIGFGCNGMGVALGSIIGEETASLLMM
jgi:glycine/D-amino acid oxidase-like deaminating enzyme